MCGLTFWRRRQASGGATRAGPVFPTRREAATEGTPPARHGGWGTRATRRGSHRNSRDSRVVTVYTSAPERLREVILANLCTLLRSYVCPQRRNSVHKCPRTAPRGHFRRSVYTLLPPRLLARPSGATGLTTTAPWPRNASALGPEAHATGAVTQPPTRTHEASSILRNYGGSPPGARLPRRCDGRRRRSQPGGSLEAREPRGDAPIGSAACYNVRWRLSERLAPVKIETQRALVRAKAGR